MFKQSLRIICWLLSASQEFKSSMASNFTLYILHYPFFFYHSVNLWGPGYIFNFIGNLYFRKMSQLCGIIPQNRKEIHKMEKSVDTSGDLVTLVGDLRELQKNTNEFLTGMINNSDDKSGTVDDGDEGEESDEEPDNKLLKLQ